MAAAAAEGRAPSGAGPAGEMEAALGRVLGVQASLEAINDELAERMLQLERQANERRAPLLAQRSEAAAAIPGFWLCALLGHPLIERYVSDFDFKVMEHLTGLEVVEEEDIKSGYSIKLNFSPNPFFANEHLSKTLSYSDDGALAFRASEIEWKPLAEDAGSRGTDEQGGRKRPREGAPEPRDAATFLRAFLWVEGEDASCLLPGEDAADSDAPPGLAEGEAFCEAIKEDVWANPVRFYERYSLLGEDSEGGGSGGEGSADERKQQKRE